MKSEFRKVNIVKLIQKSDLVIIVLVKLQSIQKRQKCKTVKKHAAPKRKEKVQQKATRKNS